ncbi:MAG: hypothetical protein M0P19_10320 [Nevskia sp.]|nr:hypothetical protein [Nevskia sp.]MCK9383256.1 hypothetical protein [Nevskia sp.]
MSGRQAAQRGGMVSLLLTLLAVGALVYFGLHGVGGTAAGKNASTSIDCEQKIAKLMKATGGLGPDYAAGYAALPTSCRGLLPPPGALDPSAAHAPET